jgi:hypothetical protein
MSSLEDLLIQTSPLLLPSELISSPLELACPHCNYAYLQWDGSKPASIFPPRSSYSLKHLSVFKIRSKYWTGYTYVCKCPNCRSSFLDMVLEAFLPLHPSNRPIQEYVFLVHSPLANLLGSQQPWFVHRFVYYESFLVERHRLPPLALDDSPHHWVVMWLRATLFMRLVCRFYDPFLAVEQISSTRASQ